MRQSLAESLAHAHVRSFIEYMREDASALGAVAGGAGQSHASHGDLSNPAGGGNQFAYFSNDPNNSRNDIRNFVSAEARRRQMNRDYGEDVTQGALNQAQVVMDPSGNLGQQIGPVRAAYLQQIGAGGEGSELDLLIGREGSARRDMYERGVRQVDAVYRGQRPLNIANPQFNDGRVPRELRAER